MRSQEIRMSDSSRASNLHPLAVGEPARRVHCDYQLSPQTKSNIGVCYIPPVTQMIHTSHVSDDNLESRSWRLDLGATFARYPKCRTETNQIPPVAHKDSHGAAMLTFTTRWTVNIQTRIRYQIACIVLAITVSRNITHATGGVHHSYTMARKPATDGHTL